MFTLDSLHGEDAILYGEQLRITSQEFVFLDLETHNFDPVPFAEVWITFSKEEQ